MEFKNFYKNIENIKYLNYEIDKNHNFELFKEICFIAESAKRNNLNIILSGAWGNIIHCNKLFRTVKDIDFVIETKHAKTWLSILDKKYDLMCPKNMQPFNFIAHQKNNQFPIPFQNKKNSKLKIDMVFNSRFEETLNKHQIFLKTFEEFNINYFFMHKISYRHIYNRKKDMDDINFYLNL